jgi:hypothetical protein
MVDVEAVPVKISRLAEMLYVSEPSNFFLEGSCDGPGCFTWDIEKDTRPGFAITIGRF